MDTLRLEVGNGNHISSQSVSDNMHLTPADTLGTHLVMSELNQFTQDDGRLVFNYDLNSYLSLQVGVLYQLRHAVYNRFFQLYNWPTTYRSFAPVFELQLRPWGWSGPILTADYDRGLKNVLGAKANYERYEFNGEYIHHLNKLQLLEARVGVGFYTRKGGKSLFLSYENFQEDNIPGGWNDNWTGEFELLDSYLYNTSDYYVRGNLTYESPLLLLSLAAMGGPVHGDGTNLCVGSADSQCASVRGTGLWLYHPSVLHGHLCGQWTAKQGRGVEVRP